ncbi:right-handed parallel beta-helix repeat-containing protein [Myxococcaceae bacterium GXIMD 01537]
MGQARRCLGGLALGWLLTGAVGCGLLGDEPRQPATEDGTSEPIARPQKPPPVISGASQSAREARPGDVVRLRATVTDPGGGSVLYTWSASAGLFSVAGGASGSSEVTWMSLACAPVDEPLTVTLTATNAARLTATHTFSLSWRGGACERPECAVALDAAGRRLTLERDCDTPVSLHVPEGFTFDGAGHTLRAVEPSGGHFKGAVLRNRGGEMHVRGLTVEAEGLEDACDTGPDVLRGILFEEASGSVVDSVVRGLRQGGAAGGCQEGHGIEVRATDPAGPVRQVEVRRNHVRDYQKTGILAVGLVDVTVADNVVDGGGPSASLLRNGIQLGAGATGRLTGNRVDGNAYTGAGAAGAGILVVGGSHHAQPLCMDVAIEGNRLTGNDVGIFLSQAEGPEALPPASSTRLRVTGNTLERDAVTNGYVYQAGITDLGGGNTIYGNTVKGVGYAPEAVPGSTFAVDVVAGEAARVAFLTEARAVGAGVCSGAVTVQSQDAAGNLKVPREGSFALEATGPAGEGVTFHADARCEGPSLTTVSLAGPQAEATFHFKAPVPGAPALRVSRAGLSAAQEQAVSGP